MIFLSGGFSLTREAFAQFGSAGAETTVDWLVGTTAGVKVISVLCTSGVLVACNATSVSDSPAWTVCATEVEITDSCSCDGPHAGLSNVIAITTAKNLYMRRSDIHISFP